jgi:hemerythrin-like domain-containing protein
MAYRETIFPFVIDKMSRIVTIATCIETSMLTRHSAAPSIINDLENKMNRIDDLSDGAKVRTTVSLTGLSL